MYDTVHIRTIPNETHEDIARFIAPMVPYTLYRKAQVSNCYKPGLIYIMTFQNVH